MSILSATKIFYIAMLFSRNSISQLFLWIKLIYIFAFLLPFNILLTFSYFLSFYLPSHVATFNRCAVIGLGSWWKSISSAEDKKVFITLSGIAQLKDHNINEDGITFGSALTLNDVNEVLLQIISQQEGV